MIPDPAQWVKGSGIAALAGEATSVAQIQSLAQELPYATGAAIKKRETDRKNKPREYWVIEIKIVVF